MALGQGTTYIDIRAKMDSLVRDLRSAETATVTAARRMGDKATSTLGSTGSKLGGAISSLGSRFARNLPIIGAGLAGAMTLSANAASDLAETMSFTRVTFKESADEMISWADTTLDSMGLARESALDAANQFGGLFQVTGSTADEAAELSKEMVQLAADMASAKNVSLDEAILALGSGLRGEAEPMRRFNVLLSEAAIQEEAVRAGIAKRGDELTEAQKVQARMNVIMRQTVDIQGDYARTSDSMANQQRKAAEAMKDTAAELGVALQPALTKAAEKATELAQAISDVVQVSEREQESNKSSEKLMRQLAVGVQKGTVEHERFWRTVQALANAEGVDAAEKERLIDVGTRLNQKIHDGVHITSRATQANVRNIQSLKGQASQAQRLFVMIERVQAAWQNWSNTVMSQSELAPFSALPTRTKPYKTTPQGPQPRAMGGPVLPRRQYLVGERGPEVLTMGSQGGNVTPNHALSRPYVFELHMGGKVIHRSGKMAGNRHKILVNG